MIKNKKIIVEKKKGLEAIKLRCQEIRRYLEHHEQKEKDSPCPWVVSVCVSVSVSVYVCLCVCVPASVSVYVFACRCKKIFFFVLRFAVILCVQALAILYF